MIEQREEGREERNCRAKISSGEHDSQTRKAKCYTAQVHEGQREIKREAGAVSLCDTSQVTDSILLGKS